MDHTCQENEGYLNAFISSLCRLNPNMLENLMSFGHHSGKDNFSTTKMVFKRTFDELNEIGLENQLLNLSIPPFKESDEVEEIELLESVKMNEICMICAKMFESVQDLKAHNTSIHENKNFHNKCPFCPAEPRFSSFEDAKAHCLIVHSYEYKLYSYSDILGSFQEIALTSDVIKKSTNKIGWRYF